MRTLRSWKGALILGVLIFLALVLVGVTVLQVQARSTISGKVASSTHLSPSTLIVGTYSVRTTFFSGPMKGQTHQGTLTFRVDGTMSSSYPAPVNLTGEGYWWPEDQTVQYSFREDFPASSGGGDVQIVHLITNLNEKTFTSTGYGIIYAAGEIPLLRAQTTNQATRLT